MSGEFAFNNKWSSQFGLLVNNVNNFGAPGRVVEKIQVPYRNGDLLIDTGVYTNYIVTYNVSLIHNAVETTRDIAEWLLSAQGYSDLMDSYNVGELRKAAFYGDINYAMEHLNRYGSANISFDCKPQRYVDSGFVEVTVAAGDTELLTNPQAFEARPLIEIEEPGTITVGNYSVTFNSGGLANRSLYIDCETLECYQTKIVVIGQPPVRVNANPYVELPDGFPVLRAGMTQVENNTTGAVIITPRWWRL